MSLTLAQLQTQFAHGLNYQVGGEACAIIADGRDPTDRLQIYRNNRVISLSEVMAATYPLLLEILGEECFAALAREYVLTHPLTNPDVSHYGERFDTLIERATQVTTIVPYATALARFEWTLDRVQQAYACEPRPQWTPLESLSTVAAEQHAKVVLHLLPWVHAFDSAYALFDLQRALHSNDVSQITLHQAQMGVIACDSEGDPWTLPLQPHAYQLLLAIEQQTPLGDIPPDALAALPSLLPLEILAGFTLASQGA